MPPAPSSSSIRYDPIDDPGSSESAGTNSGVSPNGPASWCAATSASTSARNAASAPQASARKASRRAASLASAAWKISVTCCQRSGPTSRGLVLQATVQPRARDLPLSFDGGDRKAQDMTSFFEREPAEEFQFGDLALACVEGREIRQGRIEIQHVDVTRLVLRH